MRQRRYFLRMLMPSSRSARSGTSDGRFAHQIGSLGGLGEGNHVADGGLARENHHQAIEAQRDAAVRRRAVFERVQQESEFVAGFFVADSPSAANTCACMSRR